MQAVILAGGLGTRLRAVVSDRPKPMAPVAGRPFLEYLITWLQQAGCDDLILCVGYRHEQIEAHFGDGAPFGVRIRYAVESAPLGTGGALKNAEELLRAPRSALREKATLYGARSAERGAPSAARPFLALNGDTFCDFDLRALIHAHAARRAEGPLPAVDASCLGTLALTEVPSGRDYGRVILDPEARIVAFREKESAGEPGALVSAGVYVLEPEILAHIPAGQNCSLETEVFPTLVANEAGALFGFRTPGFFVDIGTPEGYRRFTRYVQERAT